MFAICLILMGITPSGKTQAPNELNIEDPIRMMEENTIISNYSIPEKPLPIEVLLDHLSFCESSGRPDIIVWDNGSYSYGEFMFKVPTLKMYSIRYGMLPADLEDVDYANWALDGQYARRLARKIIQNGGWKNWYNCLKNYPMDGIQT